jgi:fatty-acyl-CoA synthase/long-chain acyl-CoA synthetase
VFKPDLRKHAITRVYNNALEKAGVSARVISVVDDKKRGLVAQLNRSADSDQDGVAAVLGSFTRPWEWVT